MPINWKTLTGGFSSGAKSVLEGYQKYKLQKDADEQFKKANEEYEQLKKLRNLAVNTIMNTGDINTAIEQTKQAEQGEKQAGLQTGMQKFYNAEGQEVSPFRSTGSVPESVYNQLIGNQNSSSILPNGEIKTNEMPEIQGTEGINTSQLQQLQQNGRYPMTLGQNIFHTTRADDELIQKLRMSIAERQRYLTDNPYGKSYLSVLDQLYGGDDIEFVKGVNSLYAYNKDTKELVPVEDPKKTNDFTQNVGWNQTRYFKKDGKFYKEIPSLIFDKTKGEQVLKNTVTEVDEDEYDWFVGNKMATLEDKENIKTKGYEDRLIIKNSYNFGNSGSSGNGRGRSSSAIDKSLTLLNQDYATSVKNLALLQDDYDYGVMTPEQMEKFENLKANFVKNWHFGNLSEANKVIQQARETNIKELKKFGKDWSDSVQKTKNLTKDINNRVNGILGSNKTIGQKKSALLVLADSVKSSPSLYQYLVGLANNLSQEYQKSANEKVKVGKSFWQKIK